MREMGRMGKGLERLLLLMNSCWLATSDIKVSAFCLSAIVPKVLISSFVTYLPLSATCNLGKILSSPPISNSIHDLMITQH
jgi:hypothetical protein